MTTNDLTTSATILRLDAAVEATYAALRTLGLGADAARDAILAQIIDIITTAAYERDGIPLPVADIDADDDGGGGVRTR